MDKLVCLGDSFTFGLGTRPSAKWTHLLNEESRFTVVNRGISGDTSGGMLARFDRDVLAEQPSVVMLIGGANDFIMGCDTPVVKANMMAMVHQAHFAGIDVVICSHVPLYREYAPDRWKDVTDFAHVNRMNREMAEWYPFFCRSFDVLFIDIFHPFRQWTAGDPSLYYSDGIHPNQAGHRIIADIILEHLK